MFVMFRRDRRKSAPSGRPLTHVATGDPSVAARPEQASTVAARWTRCFFSRRHHRLFHRIDLLLVVVFALKYRRRSDDERPSIHGSLVLEHSGPSSRWASPSSSSSGTYLYT